MGLQIWLPLNKDLHNQGIAKVTTSSSSSVISNYCCACNNSNYPVFNYTINQTTSFSLAFWIKIPTSITSYSQWQKFIYFAIRDNIAGTNTQINISWTTYNQLKIYDNDNFQLLWKNLPYNTWTHLVITNETVNGTYYLKIYKDGELYDSASKSGNGLSIRSGQLILGQGVESANGSVYFSDFRIYDHTLSQKEVTEMSRGCILHYPCNDILNESTINYCPYPTPGSAVGAVGWDQSKHLNAISVSGFSSGYNGGVRNPSIGYHAMWNVIDGIPTIVLNDKNSEIGQIHRWLGINTYDFRNYYTLSKGVTYTISFEAKSTVNGKCISGGFWYKKVGQTNSGSFNDGLFYKYVTTEWGKYSATFTVLYDINKDQYTSFYFYGYEKGSGSTNPEGTSYIRNIQIEIKDHATVYTPSSRAQALLYDVSGFDNHSTISGSLPLSATPKSAHYDKCMNIDNSGSNKNYANCTIAAPQVKAASFWLYIGNSNPINQILFVDLASNMGFGFNGIGNIISHTTTGPYIPAVFSSSTTIKNSWNHFVINHLGTSTELYLNGVKLSSTTNDGWTNNVNGFYFGRRVRTDYDYYYTGKVSDFRLFSRVLSQHDVDDLYKDTFIVDNKQNIYCYELIEDDTISEIDIEKNGSVVGKAYTETITSYYDRNGYVEPDGSVWIRLFHHNNPANTSNLFATTDSFTTKVYKNENAWFNMSICNQVTKWEFLVRQKPESTSAETAWRWTQPVNPMIATWDQSKLDNIVKINGYSNWAANYAGLYRYTSGTTPYPGTYLRQANASSSNWFGATGCCDIFRGGIPGFNGTVVTTGSIDIYLRIDNLKQSEQENIVKLSKFGISSHELLEI